MDNIHGGRRFYTFAARGVIAGFLIKNKNIAFNTTIRMIKNPMNGHIVSSRRYISEPKRDFIFSSLSLTFSDVTVKQPARLA